MTFWKIVHSIFVALIAPRRKFLKKQRRRSVIQPCIDRGKELPQSQARFQPHVPSPHIVIPEVTSPERRFSR